MFGLHLKDAGYARPGDEGRPGHRRREAERPGPLRATCRSLWGGEPGIGVWRFSTDGTYSAGAAGIPSLGFGPEEEQYVHTALDQVSLTKLRKAAAFYGLFPLLCCQQMGEE